MIRILAVDDDEQILRLIRNALMREGYDVTALADPIEVKRLRLEEYQLILLDDSLCVKRSGIL
jgi:DNA-binding response OmpR family regulator